MSEVILLIDCNSFYASCELLFRPDLKGRPVIVLSNNDGCVVARSKEAKKIGIPMGAPLFTIQNLVKAFDVVQFSSNYPLYNDISSRVMNTLRHFSSSIEVYSIDEAFVAIPASADAVAVAKAIRAAVLQEVGIPVSIGISHTKTLAKIAAIEAKQNSEGVHPLLEKEAITATLKQLNVVEIWGIGQKLAPKLQTYGVFTAFDLKQTDKNKLRKLFNIVVVKTALELDSIPSFTLEEIPRFPKSITCSRSFGKPIEELSLLQEALSSYTAQAAEKLYKAGGTAGGVIVFLTTNRFSEPYYSNSVYIPLAERTFYPPALMEKGLEGLSEIYRKGYFYKKVGVTFVDLALTTQHQLTLFQEQFQIPKKQKELVEAVHRIKKRFGIDAVQYASEGIQKSWKTRKDQRSPLYTTVWEDILTIRI
jgi:DNA polymerase V